MLPYNLGGVKVKPYTVKADSAAIKKDLAVFNRAVADALRSLKQVRKSLNATKGQFSTPEMKKAFDSVVGSQDNDAIAQAELALQYDLKSMQEEAAGLAEGSWR